MNFAIPGDGEASREAARAFGDEVILPSVIERDQGRLWSGALFERMGRAGLLGAPLPTAHGGGGRSALETCLTQEGFGQGAGDAGLGLAWGAHTLLCGAPIAALGTAEQQGRALPEMCAGTRVAALAADEAATGADPVRIRTRAHRRGNGWVLSGEKSWVINGPVAHLFLITAVTAPERGAEGISAFLVERGTPGLCAGSSVDLPGMRTAAIGSLTLEECEVPAEFLLGPEGGGVTHVLRVARRWERSLLLAPWLGLMRAMIERSARHARSRVDFGRPVASSQAARAMLADMMIRLELGRRMVHRAACEIDGDPGDGRHAALAKLFLSNQARASTADALQIHGLSGLCADAHVERWCRDALLLTLVGGASELLCSVIAAGWMEPR